MSDYPYMNFWVKDWIAKTQHLTAAERGAYMSLLCIAWLLPGCRLPNDNTKLFRWSGVGRPHWPRVKQAVLEGFWDLSDDGKWWTQKRQLEVRAIAEGRSAQRAENGRKGGRPKGVQDELPLEGGFPLREHHKGNTSRGVPFDGSNPLQNQDLPKAAGSFEKTYRKANQNQIHNTPGGSRREPPPLEGGDRRRTFPLPENWRPNREHYAFAAMHDQPSMFVDELADTLRTWAAANGRVRKTNWDAEFKLRLKRAVTAETGKKPATTRQPSAISELHRHIVEMNRVEKDDEHDPGPEGPEILPPVDYSERAQGGDAGMDETPRRAAQQTGKDGRPVPFHHPRKGRAAG
jgi:uncharacterized protein YdaU (DUF1376 family)